MTHALLTPSDDYDPVDQQRACDLGRAGLEGWCATISIDRDGEEHLLLARYSQGPEDYLPASWSTTAPHEVC